MFQRMISNNDKAHGIGRKAQGNFGPASQPFNNTKTIKDSSRKHEKHFLIFFENTSCELLNRSAQFPGRYSRRVGLECGNEKNGFHFMFSYFRDYGFVF